MSATATRQLEVEFAEKMQFLFEPCRYKVAYGGRYGVKSWSFARALLLIGLDPSLLWPGRKTGPRILCARETQKSIQESVHHLLENQIERMGLRGKYTIRQHSISAPNGAEFIFAGIRQNVSNIKSYEDCDICWVEEAVTVSKNSWKVLIPTIRKEGSEIWVSFNPELESDETYQHFIVRPPAHAKVVRTTWRDNPWLSKVIIEEMRDLKKRSEDDYNHVYEGQCKQTVEGAIYRSELIQADKECRVTRVPYDAQHPVHTFWDLGFGDNTSIWFAQSMPFEFRIIDHLSGSLQALQYYVKQLRERPYVYGMHWLPWDGEAKELGSGRSIQEQLQTIFGNDKVRCTKRLSVSDGIAAARAIFGRCWFDAEKCADGLQSLRHYRYERDENLGSFKREPLHDWASHDADAFRTLAVAIQDFKRPEPKREEPVPTYSGRQSDGAWMG
jgi:phage terminase large subunit